ncbi:MAG TPA: pyridoxamine 5'-phosphate oxidase family protein [Thermoanaerobaculia bacterium]|nr:pyridoxamine 5'-phosphate oxidase family protein [Thermoanaerobaculia bacterium]
MRSILENLPRILAGHDAIAVGTRDAAMRPACSMAVGVAFPGEGRVTVYVPEATGARTLADLEANGAIAVVFEEIPTHHTVQLKGRVTEIRPAGERERELVERSIGGFFAQVEAVGGPPAVVRRKRRWPCRAVTFAVADVFEQTPGPKAGTPFVADGAR